MEKLSVSSGPRYGGLGEDGTTAVSGRFVFLPGTGPVTGYSGMKKEISGVSGPRKNQSVVSVS